ncbi:MAG: hypothetical protein Fur002_08940 [Anaerolineales bacterium]
MEQKANSLQFTQTLQYAVIGALFGATFPLVGTLFRMLLLRMPVTLQNGFQAQAQDPLLWVVDTAPIVLGIFASYAGYKQDLIILANAELNQREKELKEERAKLEERVLERTAELERANQYNQNRAAQFEGIAAVSRVINQTQNLQDVLPQITQVISQQFGFYHVGVFLLDPQGEYAVLSAANSEGGQRMLDRNHKLRVGQVGIVGYVAESGKPRIALDTGEDAIYFNNPDLPATRSEMALPLLQADKKIIGVLDIQSIKPEAFSRENIEILTALADQVAVSISNARQYEETQKNLIESEILYRRDLQAGWKKFTRAQKITGVQRARLTSKIYTEPFDLPGMEEVFQTGSPYIRQGKEAQITLPVKLRGETIGMLHVKTDAERKWSDDDIDILTAIVERAALAIESARLLAESRKAAEKERVIGEISARVSSFTNRDNILQAAVVEIGRALPGAEVILQLQGKHQNKAEAG